MYVVHTLQANEIILPKLIIRRKWPNSETYIECCNAFVHQIFGILLTQPVTTWANTIVHLHLLKSSL